MEKLRYSTRELVQRSTWYLSTKTLLDLVAQLSEAHAVYKKYENVHFWTPHKNYYNQKIHFSQEIKIGLRLLILVQVDYWETENQCIVQRKILVNKNKRTLRVLNTILDELDKQIEQRIQFANKIQHFTNTVSNKFRKIFIK